MNLKQAKKKARKRGKEDKGRGRKADNADWADLLDQIATGCSAQETNRLNRELAQAYWEGYGGK